MHNYLQNAIVKQYAGVSKHTQRIYVYYVATKRSNFALLLQTSVNHRKPLIICN